MSNNILTPGDVMVLADIVTAVQNGSRIRRVAGDDIVTGTVRGFVADADGNPGLQGRDIRDVYLRVTLTSGWDAHYSMGEMIKEVASREAVFDKR